MEGLKCQTSGQIKNRLLHTKPPGHLRCMQPVLTCRRGLSALAILSMIHIMLVRVCAQALHAQLAVDWITIRAAP